MSVPTPGNDFAMTTYRLTLGLRYNPIHMIQSSNSTNLTNKKTPVGSAGARPDVARQPIPPSCAQASRAHRPRPSLVS
jgi:hypothetical protein